VVDDKEQVNALSTKDLRNLFKLRTGTPSDTHDKLKCERCQIIHDSAEMEARLVLPKKLAACKKLLEEIIKQEDAQFFLKPLEASEHGKTKEEYEKLVKQPMDLETISKRLDLPPESATAYKSVSGFSKDVNRIFSNVMKVWDLEEDLTAAARRLQSWWIDQWTLLVPQLMAMKPGDDNDQSKKAAVSEDAQGSTEDDVLASCSQINNERSDDYQEQVRGDAGRMTAVSALILLVCLLTFCVFCFLFPLRLEKMGMPEEVRIICCLFCCDALR